MPRHYLIILLSLAVLVLTGCQNKQQEVLEPAGAPEVSVPKTMGQLKLKSPAFPDQGKIPSKYTCDGEDVNPCLEISGAPETAKSLVLIVDDPDAPGGDWVHWLVWNIAPETAQIMENSVPSGAIQGKTDFGKSQYGGPCPPSGTHRYQFKLYALDTILDLPSSTAKKDLERAIKGHILDQAVLTGLYSRIRLNAK
jgi:Raf kinase inhibitor-like YbhB/YbcL family protein